MHKARKVLLIVDDDRNFSLSLRDHLRTQGLDVLLASSGAECRALCAEHRIDAVLLDQQLPDARGADLCSTILASNGQAKIIFTTAFPSFDNAVQAVREGAFDYLSKPFELEELDLVVKQALRTLDLEKVEQLQHYRSDREREENVLVGAGGKIEGIRTLIELAAGADAAVLITGETGSGKNVAARAIHDRGPLREAPFVSINCAALPESLIEAELFGYERGAFTGAGSMKKGLFEMAEGGTLFLDEIGELPVGLQAKLLGVLDDGIFRRLGGTTALAAQVRIIAATGVDLDEAIRRRRFREDLFYRLGVIRIQIPPLRDRLEDIPALCSHLIASLAKKRTVRLPEDELAKLTAYDWPGNVRELRNVLERALILQQGADLRPSELIGQARLQPIRRHQERTAVPQADGMPSLAEVEKNHILAALEAQGNNYSRAARAIGISLSTLRRRLREYGID